MKLAIEIKKVQDHLRQMYSTEEYEKIVSKIKDKVNNDPEVLAYMASDRSLSPEIKLFAVAAMGE